MVNGFVNLTAAGTVHVARTCVGIIVGAEQLPRRRRDRMHRYQG